MTGTHGTTGKGGGQAFGSVELDVKHDRIEAAGDFVCNVMCQQLIPAILMLNYGDTEEMPTMRLLEDKEAGLAEAQRDGELAKLGLEIGVDYLRKKYDIPPPAAGEETVGGAPQLPQGFGGFGGPDTETPEETKAPNEEPESQDLAAGDAPGHPFRGNQHVRIGNQVKTPYGTGIVISTTEPGHAWVSIAGIMRRVRKSDMQVIPADRSGFPSITQSAEDTRRRMLNAQLETKLEMLNEIKDDAIYSAELKRLAGIIVNQSESESQPQVINVNVEAATVTPTRKTFTIKRDNGTVIEGEINASEDKTDG
jgi:hypothetical protein